MRNFRQLEVWERSLNLADKVYSLCQGFPKSEIYGITHQIQRCAVSIPSNIAEGCSRDSQKEFSRFIQIALGSSFELETQLLIAQKRGYFLDNEDLLIELTLIQKKLNSLYVKLRDVS